MTYLQSETAKGAAVMLTREELIIAAEAAEKYPPNRQSEWYVGRGPYIRY